jgi:hypothetical protein
MGVNEQMIIEARFNGPPESGNGGFTAGLVAAALGAERTGAVVTLRVPPPLDTPMLIRSTEQGIAVYAGEQLVAEAAATVLDEEPVPAVPYDEALAAATAYPGFVDHPFPTCYVCGPKRIEGDGLRIFPGLLPDGRTAAPWTVPTDVTAVTLWAALDCPGGWSIIAPGRPYVLGRMAARVRAVPPPGARCVVTGAVAEVEGRKALVHSALYSENRILLAQARSTWIAI